MKKNNFLLVKDKRGIEMTMSTIIIAVLVILVLVVLILIFNKSIQSFFFGTQSCQATGGHCEAGGENGCPEGMSNVFSGNPECDKRVSGGICCKQQDSILGIGSGNN